jgi:hypothetical protein
MLGIYNNLPVGFSLAVRREAQGVIKLKSYLKTNNALFLVP